MLTPTEVVVGFSDGVERRFPVEPGQSVLDAALAAEVPVLFQCRTGSCGSCLARLTEGEAAHAGGVAGSLLPGEREEGYRLLCLTAPGGGCRFALSYDSDAGRGRAVAGQCFVNAVERIAADVVRLELELAEGFWMDFRPGQFIQVKVPGTDQTRSYSMASTARDLPRIELLIRILPGGVMSDWLVNRAAVNDVVEVSGPYGQFFLKEKQRGAHVMIAGGTGLAPMMAMLDALRQSPGKKPRVILSFGCQNPEGLFALDEIGLRRDWMPSLDTRISIDRGVPPEGIRLGNPVAALSAEDGLGADSIAYLCGPPGMIEAARRHLEDLGLLPENIHAEQFVASA